MKKLGMLFLCLFTIILSTGCGMKDQEQKLVCTTTEDEDGIHFEQVIRMTYKNDKLKHMTMEVNTKITDATVQKSWNEYKKNLTENNKEYNKDGVSLKVTINDENYEYNTMLDIDIENASEEALKEQGFEDLKNDTSTLEDSKEAAEKDGAVCEVK